MIYFLSRNLFYLFLSVFCRIRVRAAKDFPRRGPVIIASNHVSFLDPAILGCVTGRRIDFMAR
ncbi:MAG: 1-acyl-sn-glycerol-3-phosphate acyltransferase, partial [Candidatus Omnitrophota bacterium]